GDRQQLLLEILGGDLIERTGWNFGRRDAQLLGLDNDFLALDSELFGNIVDTNGHNSISSTDWRTAPACSSHGEHDVQSNTHTADGSFGARRATSALTASTMAAACSPICGISARSATSAWASVSKVARPA